MVGSAQCERGVAALGRPRAPLYTVIQKEAGVLITFISLLFLLRQVFCPYFGYHTHIVYCVNLERSVQKTTMTQGIQGNSSTARLRMLQQSQANPAKLKLGPSQQPQSPPDGETAPAWGPALPTAKGARQTASTGFPLLLNLPPVIHGALLTTDLAEPRFSRPGRSESTSILSTDKRKKASSNWQPELCPRPV